MFAPRENTVGIVFVSEQERMYKRHTVEDEGGWINPNINSIYTKASICIGSISKLALLHRSSGRGPAINN